jgi:hypothetical protein
MLDSNAMKATSARRGLQGKIDRLGGSITPRHIQPPEIIQAELHGARLRLLAERIHGLGPAPLYHLLAELAGGAEVWPRLEAYARLAPLAGFIAALDGDRLPRPRLVQGGRQ